MANIIDSGFVLIIKEGSYASCYYEIKLNRLDLTITSVNAIHNEKETLLDNTIIHSNISNNISKKINNVLHSINKMDIIDKNSHSNHLYIFELYIDGNLIRRNFGYDKEIFKIIKLLFPFIDYKQIQCNEFFILFNKLRIKV